jgi:integrase
MNRPDLEGYLSKRAVTPKDPEKPKSLMGARLHNAHVTTFNAFGMWCERQGYVKTNPFSKMITRNEEADARHIRRVFTQDELIRLFAAAESRPLLDALKGNSGRGTKMIKSQAKLTDKTMDHLRWLGKTRAMAYKVAVGTGLRWGELRSITLGAVQLNAGSPHLLLEACNEKARRGAEIPIPEGLVAELNEYLAERRSRLTGHSGTSVVAFPGSLEGVKVFDVPENMCRVFDADLKAAQIPKYDSAGRVVDVHALRHTFGTLLAKAGVALQLVQRAMRHSTPALTAKYYLHLELYDKSQAVNVLMFFGMVSQEQKTVAQG